MEQYLAHFVCTHALLYQKIQRLLARGIFFFEHYTVGSSGLRVQETKGPGVDKTEVYKPFPINCLKQE